MTSNYIAKVNDNITSVTYVDVIVAFLLAALIVFSVADFGCVVLDVTQCRKVKRLPRRMFLLFAVTPCRFIDTVVPVQSATHVGSVVQLLSTFLVVLTTKDPTSATHSNVSIIGKTLVIVGAILAIVSFRSPTISLQSLFGLYVFHFLAFLYTALLQLLSFTWVQTLTYEFSSTYLFQKHEFCSSRAILLASCLFINLIGLYVSWSLIYRFINRATVGKFMFPSNMGYTQPRQFRKFRPTVRYCGSSNDVRKPTNYRIPFAPSVHSTSNLYSLKSMVSPIPTGSSQRGRYRNSSMIDQSSCLLPSAYYNHSNSIPFFNRMTPTRPYTSTPTLERYS